MKNKMLALSGLILLAILLLGQTAQAQPPAGYSLARWQVGGGGALAGGSYTLLGVSGQAEAGPALSGGAYTLKGGFLGGNPDTSIYLPLLRH
jgi:uncharacterized membrane protein